jgi:hypothetical protein
VLDRSFKANASLIRPWVPLVRSPNADGFYSRYIADSRYSFRRKPVQPAFSQHEGLSTAAGGVMECLVVCTVCPLSFELHCQSMRCSQSVTEVPPLPFRKVLNTFALVLLKTQDIPKHCITTATGRCRACICWGCSL